ncbi:hypothetical protein RJ639_002143 [Escallonia herrerae]|uniref:non-specific serine/threonine protein kinase n=1 Tax=Escallonia herrerae TaxID=1293975 RepID=A0AA88XFM6_9ASTE|nr:hypothetical protein RJ639_002143 [Escallonia herrerae]
MGSFHGNCEIVEAKEELNSVQQSQRIYQQKGHDQGRRPPLLKQGCNSSLEDDINKLFETISRKTSLSDEAGAGLSRRNASKRPMRESVSPSPGIGFSEPVSLKQALRGLCISQASEMAANKRLPKAPGSPAVSEAGKLSILYRSIVVETRKSGSSLAEGRNGKFEISLVPEESTSNSLGKMPQYLQEPSTKSANHSACSSPGFALETTVKRTGSTLGQKEIVHASTVVGSQPPKVELVQEAKGILVASLPCHSSGDDMLAPDENISASAKLSSNRKKKVSTSIKLTSKAAPKLRPKGRLQNGPSSSSPISSSKLNKSTRNVPRPVKAVIRTKNSIKKKLKEDSTTSSKFNEVNDDLDPGTSHLICQKCQCNLKVARIEKGKESPAPLAANNSTEVRLIDGNNGTSKPRSISHGSDRSYPVVVNTKKISKSTDKGEFSQSSKSSAGEYSCSTSISEESSLSTSSFGNRPHMSKDLRWEAIRHVMKQHGFIGLGHFNLLKKLGCGDIGTVYLAELIGTSCPFAIKVMDNEFLARRKKMPRAETEREILKILDHPFLPTLYAQFISDNLSCLVTEYCPGGDLHVLRQKQPGRYFPEQAARFYVAEVLLALEYLHMLGVVYRDLKPENILVREDGHIMLTDFDLSLRCSVSPTLVKSSPLGVEPPRMSGPCAGSNCIDPFCIKPTCQVSCFSPRIFPASAKTSKQKPDLAAQMRSLHQLVAEPTDARSNSFVGTHEYLAPEIIKGEGHGSAVDWWTFGVFLYELLYGKTPFKGPGNEETLANVVLQSLTFPETPLVSFQARDLIRVLLAKEPENRLGSQRGAAEIKQHPFFDGLNWALIRCAVPPQVPEVYESAVSKIASMETGTKYLDCGAAGEQLEFELF